MTQQEALQEAQRRWGFFAWVKTFTDGSRTVGAEFTTLGEGDSWEAAFVDAGRKKESSPDV